MSPLNCFPSLPIQALRRQPCLPGRRTPTPRIRLPGKRSTFFPPRSLPTRIECDRLPLDVWWDLVDLWTRLHQLGRLQLVDLDVLLLPTWRSWHDDPDLRAAVLDLESYRWRCGLLGDGGSFVQALDYNGDDLFCMLTPITQVRCWPDGPSLVQSRFAQLARLPGPNQAGDDA